MPPLGIKKLSDFQLQGASLPDPLSCTPLVLCPQMFVMCVYPTFFDQATPLFYRYVEMKL